MISPKKKEKKKKKRTKQTRIDGLLYDRATYLVLFICGKKKEHTIILWNKANYGRGTITLTKLEGNSPICAVLVFSPMYHSLFTLLSRFSISPSCKRKR